MMWGVATAPEPTSAPVPRPPLWPHVVRWAVLGMAGVLAASLTGITAAIGIRAAPPGPTFAWPYRLTGRTNILIMGLDRTVSDQNPNVVYAVSRTDTLIAASVDPATRRVYLLSIPRDTRAPIPGRGVDKVNAAHAYGGAPLTLRTVQNFLGVAFPYYVELHVRGRSHLLRETMSALEQKLNPAKFIRIHRSRIVRSSSLVELRSIDNREYFVKLSDGSEHRSSRTYADRLDAWLTTTKS